MYNGQDLTDDEIWKLWIFSENLEHFKEGKENACSLIEYIHFKGHYEKTFEEFSQFLDELKEKYGEKDGD